MMSACHRRTYPERATTGSAFAERPAEAARGHRLDAEHTRGAGRRRLRAGVVLGAVAAGAAHPAAHVVAQADLVAVLLKEEGRAGIAFHAVRQEADLGHRVVVAVAGLRRLRHLRLRGQGQGQGDAKRRQGGAYGRSHDSRLHPSGPEDTGAGPGAAARAGPRHRATAVVGAAVSHPRRAVAGRTDDVAGCRALAAGAGAGVVGGAAIDAGGRALRRATPVGAVDGAVVAGHPAGRIAGIDAPVPVPRIRGIIGVPVDPVIGDDGDADDRGDRGRQHDRGALIDDLDIAGGHPAAIGSIGDVAPAIAGDTAMGDDAGADRHHGDDGIGRGRTGPQIDVSGRHGDGRRRGNRRAAGQDGKRQKQFLQHVSLLISNPAGAAGMAGECVPDLAGVFPACCDL